MWCSSPSSRACPPPSPIIAVICSASFPAPVGRGRALLPHYFGCGDSLLRRAALPGPEPFSASANQTGGEDDRLFRVMRSAGARSPGRQRHGSGRIRRRERLTLGYALRRAFALRPGRDLDVRPRRAPNPLAVAAWMAVGLAQATLFGLAAAGPMASRRAATRQHARSRRAQTGSYCGATPSRSSFMASLLRPTATTAARRTRRPHLA